MNKYNWLQLIKVYPPGSSYTWQKKAEEGKLMKNQDLIYAPVTVI